LTNHGTISIHPANATTKKGIRYLVLLTFFLLIHFSALAQLKPKWVDDLRGPAGGAVTTYIAVDKQNNIYVTGYFMGTVDFDPSPGVKNLTAVGGADVFIGKYTQSGTLIWAESVGGTNYDLSTGLAVDKDGNVSISGYFYSKVLDADPGPGVYDLNGSSTGASTGFIIHLNTSGGFLWANSVEGGGLDITWQVTTDSEDNVITTSQFDDYLTIGDSTFEASGNPTALITKYGPAGNVLWFLNFNQSGTFSSVYGIAVDSQDNIVVSGLFTGKTNFNYLGGAPPYYIRDTSTNVNYAPPWAFIAKYKPSGALLWVNAASSPFLTDGGFSTVAVDKQNNVYFSDLFGVSISFGAISFNFSGEAQQACLAKYSSAGVLQFAEPIGAQQGAGYYGGISDVNYMTFDSNDNLYLSGYFRNTVNFNANTAPVNLTSHGYYPSFYIAKYDTLGKCTYAAGAGGNCDSTSGVNVAIDGNNNIDIAGGFCSTVNFDLSGCSPLSLTADGSTDPFFAQYQYTPLVNNIITPPAINSFCTTGTPAAITGNLPAGGNGTYTYQWLISADSVTFTDIGTAKGQNYTPPTITATTYYERMVSSDTCTTPSVSNVVKITISGFPAAPAAASDTTCNGSTATLSVRSPQTGFTYNWYSTATGDTSIFTGISFTTPLLTAATTYYVEAVNSTGCSSATRTAATVTLLQPLVAPVVTPGSATASAIIFTWAAVPGATGYRVSTDGGSIYTAVNGLTDTISNLQGGQSVSIMVEAIGSIACQLSVASAAVTGPAISPTDDIIYVANAFTPNGDGRDDVLHVRSENIKTLKFSIYDQWGELLFTSTNQQNGWDGTYKGSREPTGVYVYAVEAVMNDGTSVDKKGTVTLLK
jgi:gliding motility-associated-like protein